MTVWTIRFLRVRSALQGVAITQENSLLDNTARIEGWLARFPMFDWVGGRTSEMSAVGLLPAALQVNAFPFFLYVDFIHTLSN
jgi:glucose-6-phosphate isomerase